MVREERERTDPPSAGDPVKQYVLEEVSNSIQRFFSPLFFVLPGPKKKKRKTVTDHPTLRLPLPLGTKPTDLSPLVRIGWIFALMICIGLALGVFLAGLEGLARLGRELG